MTRSIPNMKKKIGNDFTLGWNLNKTHRPLRIILKEDGFVYFLKASFDRLVTGSIIVIIHSTFRKYFVINGQRYKYLRTKLFEYDARGERVVEIPFVESFYKGIRPNSVLEIGNVTRKWFSIENHIIVDKYEIGTGIINADVESFHSNNKFDLIISISTIEHVGFDEVEKNEMKPLTSIQNLLSMLSEDGNLVITVPIRYNPTIDRIIIEKMINYDRIIFLNRYSRLNLWRECSLEKALSAKYGSKYQFANSVAFIILSKRH